jgi:hypothetical protein
VAAPERGGQPGAGRLLEGKRMLLESYLRRLCFRLRGMLAPSAVEREIDEELRFHLRLRAAEHSATGLQPDEARAEALRQFGDYDRVRESCRRLHTSRPNCRVVMRPFWSAVLFLAGGSATFQLVAGPHHGPSDLLLTCLTLLSLFGAFVLARRQRLQRVRSQYHQATKVEILSTTHH